MTKSGGQKLGEILAAGGEAFAHPRESRPGEIYIDLPGADARSAAAYLRSAGCRHVSVFAEDRTAEESLAYLYYIFEHPADSCYLILRAPVDPSQPEFPSMAAGVPALNSSRSGGLKLCLT